MKACADLLPVKDPEGPELLPKDGVFVCGRRWDSNHTKILVCGPGKNVEGILLDGMHLLCPGREESVYARSLALCRVRLDGSELSRDKWRETYPAPGARMEFLYAPGKGGGGKNVLSSVLSIVVAVAAVWAGPALAGAMGLVTSTGALTTVGTLVAAGTTAAIMVAGGWAINSLFPVSQPSLSASQQALETSQTYSISGGQNSANLNGYVPLVLGTYRMTPPLGAKSWTMRSGDDQYFNMLVIWGHADVSVTDFRIGETPLSKFSGVTHVFHGASTGNDLRYFAKSYNEQSIGATLDYNVPVTRSVGECDSISVEIAFSSLANLSSGSAQATSVQFKIEYALEGSNSWKTFASTYAFHCPAQYVDCYTGASESDAWASSDGTWHVRQSDSDWSNPNWTNGKIQVTDPHFSPYPVESYSDSHKHHEWRFRACDYNAGTVNYVTITGSQTTTLARTFEWSVPHGKYQVRITRLTPDTDDATIQDTGVWNIARAITNKAAFNTPLPVACSELRIKASEELSGYVSDFNALVKSYIPDWNGSSWVKDETANPASELRYILTSQHGSYRPWTASKIDEESFREFHDFCEKEGFTFNYVCDTEMLTWKRLSQIAAAGRGAVTLDNDGKFSIIIDKAGKVPVQMFTPRNSWGLTVQRSFTRAPHALRATFRDASSDYDEVQNYVYADGYNASNATNILEWECEGKTNWNEVWRFGRYYLASMKLRPETITLSTDWEWRMCRRGDLVAVASDVLTNTFGTARIQRLIYSVDGELVYVGREEDIPHDDSGADLLPVGVQLDDSVYYSEPSPARYGIAVRLSTGRLATYEVQPKYGEESADLTFMYALSAAQVPPLGALADVALFGSDGEMEYGEYLVSGITPGDDMSADLTLIPYAPEIMDADKGEIPAWNPPIRLDTVPNKNNLPTPVITETRSDESVLIRSGDSIISCIAAWYRLPSSPDATLGEIQVQMRAVSDFGQEFTAYFPMTAPYPFVQGVQDGQAYTVTLRLVSSRGVTSQWSQPVVVVVVGKTSRPPVPEGFTAVPQNPEGIRVSWQAVTVADFDHYEVSGAAEAKTIDTSVILPVYGRTGAIPFELVSVDTLGLKSSPAAAATATVEEPAVPSPTYEVLTTEGARIRWQDCMTTWGIDHYVVEDLYTGETINYADTQFSISPRPIGNVYDFHIQAVDIFQNVGPVKDFSVSIGEIEAPKPSASVDGTQLVISWSAVLSPFQIDVYEVADDTGKVLGTVKGTTFRFLAPAAGVWNYKVRAVDIIGQASAWGECGITLTYPKAPQVSALLEDDHIALTWTQPALDGSQVPVIAYDVVRQWDVERDDGIVETMEQDYGRTDALALSVPAVTAGDHSFMVRAVDNSGNIGPWGYADFVAQAPGRVTFFDCSAVDNNVMIYYTAPNFVFFPIKEYLIEDISDGLGAEVGRTDANFFADIRSAAGDYTYGVTPVDIAGNIGQRSTITIAVSSPPDFILYSDYHSLFNGSKTNMILDGEGHMIGPVPVNETWQENTERVAGQLGMSAENVSWQDKVDGGMQYFVSPPVESGVYSEIVDVGTLIPSTKISVIITSDALEDNPSFTCKIEVSEDKQAWRTAAENATAVYATSFRYVRYTLTWTGGLVSVSDIYYRLDVKRKMDFGQVAVAADDNGEGWVSMEETPLLTGKWVPFTVSFADVQSFPQPQVVNDTGKTAHIVFEDKLNPSGFRIFALDKNGNRVAATIDWAAYGV